MAGFTVVKAYLASLLAAGAGYVVAKIKCDNCGSKNKGKFEKGESHYVSCDNCSNSGYIEV